MCLSFITLIVAYSILINGDMCTFTLCQSGISKDLATKDQCCRSFIILAVISFYIASISFSLFPLPLSFSLHMRCYLGPLNQVTSHSCLCPWEDRVLSTVRTHCSTSGEEEMKRLEVALTAVPRPLNRQRDKGEKGRWRETEKCEWENACQSLATQLSLSVISACLNMAAEANATLTPPFLPMF